MSTNNLLITTAGYTAAANAKAGGFKINITAFAVGDGNKDPEKADVALNGNTLYRGTISLVEVISNGVAKFTVDIPKTPNTFTIYELALFMEDGTMFGRGIFTSPTEKDASIELRIFVIVAASDCDLTTLSITVGDVYSIPSVPYVHVLPPPNSSLYNAIAVLDQKYNYDLSSSGSIAIKYGAGGLAWSFIGYSRIYFGVPDSGSGITLTTSRFKIASILNDYTLKSNELFIVQIVNGAGQGESRRVYYDSTSSTFIEIDSSPFTALDATSNLALWRATEGSGVYTLPSNACKWPPDTTGVPEDWVLTRGTSCPKWVSMKSVTDPSGSGSGLSVAPFSLHPNHVYFTGNGARTNFDTGLQLTTTNTLISISGITQHKEAYDVQGSYVVFSEAPPPGVAIEVIVYTQETSAGAILEFHTQRSRDPGNGTADTILSSFMADGVVREFRLNIDYSVPNPFPPSEHYVMCWITGIKQNLNAFLYDKRIDANGNITPYIVFNEAPKAGLDIQLTWIRKVDRPNYATLMYTNIFIGTGVQETLNLSVEPEDYNYVFVYVSGVLLHSDKYTLTGSQITIPDSIQKDLPIMVVIFKNVISEGAVNTQLSGVVTGAIITDKYLKLLRYNANDFLIPNQRINLIPGDGIEIVGDFPNYTIKSTVDSRRRVVNTRRFSTLYSQDNSEEIIYTYKFVYDVDYIVSVTADFSCRLGQGFKSADGGEYLEYVLGFKAQNINEPPYGRRIKGTGTAGFCHLPGAQLAYANASITQTYEFNINKTKTDTVTFVAKMRVVDGNVSRYKSAQDITFSLVATPKVFDVFNQ